MKKNFKNILRVAAVGFALVTTASCVNNDLDLPEPSTSEVRLWGGLDRKYAGKVAPAATRGTASSTSGILTPTSQEELNIGIARVSKLEDADVFPDFRSLGDPLAATLGQPDPNNSFYRPIEFKHQAQFFPDAKNELRYVGWYPWNESDLATPNVDDDGNRYLSDELKTEVTFDISGDEDILYGNMIEGTLASGFPVMEFNHALCLFRIYAYGMVGGVDADGNPISSSEQWGELQEITMQDSPAEVVLTLPHNCPEVPPLHTSGDEFTISYRGKQDLLLHDESNNIFFDAPEQLPTGVADAVLVSKFLSGPPTTGVLSLLMRTSLQTATQEVSIARNFKAGHAYDIILRFSDHGIINIDVSIGEWQMGGDINEEMAVNMYYDLSTYETSNSYIVSSANYDYCFDVTVKGNGDGSLMGMTDADTRIEGATYAEILWDDMPTFDHDGDASTPEVECVSIAHHGISDGRVLFELQGYVDSEGNTDDKSLPVEGNALIGVYDKRPEEGGRLLWAWHLWVTDRPKGIGCSNGYVVQDRNLGAISDTPTGEDFGPADGLHYQWGRPTPLKLEGLGVSSELLTFQNLYPDDDPNKIYGSGNAEHAWLDHHSQWAEHHDHMWGDPGVDYERHTKTFLDPCPPGYFVSNHAFWQGIEQYEIAFDRQMGVQLKVVNDSFWLPMAEVLDDEGHATAGFEGVGLRTATIDPSTADHVPYYLAYTDSKTVSVSSENSYCNYAYSVRCISLATDPVTVDLSESQTANSYMVYSPGYYKFRANVRGNGVSQMWPYGGTSMLDISDGMDVNIRPAKVDLLWWQGDFTEVTNTEEDIEKLMCIHLMNEGKPDKDGYVSFYIPEIHAGNAVLAAYDTDGTILWSWHIWLLRERPEDVLSGKRTLQDRFLGATHAPEIVGSNLTFRDYAGAATTSREALWSTFGFYYQWGRKDPVLGAPVALATNAGAENPSNGATTLNTSTYWLKDYTTGEWSRQTTIPRHVQVDIKEAVKSPLTFYISSTSAGAATSQWFSADFADTKRNVALWGYAVDDYSVQGQDFSKTMYDPCPPGYRTAFHQVWKITVDGTIYAYGGDDGGVTSNSWNSAESVYWNNGEGDYSDYGFVTNKSYFDNSFFPYSGLRLATTGGYSNIYTHGYLETGMPMGQYNTRTFLYCSDGWSRQISGSGATTTNDPTGSNHATAYAKPIRCMKE